MIYQIGDLVEYDTIGGSRLLGKVTGFFTHLDRAIVRIRVTSRTNRFYPLGYILDVPVQSVFLRKRSR